MKSEQGLILIALILGIVGGVLLCKGSVDAVIALFNGKGNISVKTVVLFGIGFIAIAASALLLKGSYIAGGLMNVILGILTVSYGKDAEGLMVLISGIIGIVAPKIRD